MAAPERERREIASLRAKLCIETEMRKKAEELVYTFVKANFEEKSETPPLGIYS